MTNKRLTNNFITWIGKYFHFFHKIQYRSGQVAAPMLSLCLLCVLLHPSSFYLITTTFRAG